MTASTEGTAKLLRTKPSRGGTQQALTVSGKDPHCSLDPSVAFWALPARVPWGRHSSSPSLKPSSQRGRHSSPHLAACPWGGQSTGWLSRGHCHGHH